MGIFYFPVVPDVTPNINIELGFGSCLTTSFKYWPSFTRS